MNRYILRLALCLTIFSCFAWPQTAKASHAAGGEILYEWISGSTYRIILKFYRDCAGINEPATFQLCYYNDCNAIQGSVIMTKTGNTTGIVIPQPCPGGSQVATNCTGGALPGFREFTYEVTVTLPSQCDKWTFYTMESARNGATTNIAGGNWFCEATLNNLNAQGNSSPQFTIKPVPYVCTNYPYTYNNGAVDPNNDSLSFEFIKPRDYAAGLCSGVTPATTPELAFLTNTGAFPAVAACDGPPYNITTNPFQTRNTFVFNQQTGMMSFTPYCIPSSTPINVQTATICVRVTEWREGRKIGTVIRDIQVKVIPCTVPTPVITNVFNTVVNAVYEDSMFKACTNQNMNFCFDVEISDTSIAMNITDNSGIATPGATLTYTGNMSDSVRGCFNWTPTTADTGLKILVVNVQACNNNSQVPPITQSFTIPIYIWAPTRAVNDTTICSTDSVRLNVTGGRNFVWSVLPGGSTTASLSCTNCKDPIAKPTMTTSYVVTSMDNTYCPTNKDTVVVTVLNQPDINLGPDLTTCVNNPVQLNTNLVQQPGVNYAITWTPATFLNNPNINDPISNPTADISYVVTVSPNNLTSCFKRDTINITTILGYDLLTPDTAICKGDNVQIRTTGDNRYTYTWTPPNGVSVTNIANPTITPDTTRKYTVTATYPGCRDSVQSLTIDVQPIPTVDIFQDLTLCYGDTIHIKPKVEPTWYTNYSYSWTPAGSVSNNTSKDVIYEALQDTKPLTLTVTTPAGCTGSDDKDITVIQVNFLTVSNDTAICPGESAQLHASGPIFDIYWKPNYNISDTNAFDPIVNPASTTIYTVSARDENYCYDTASIKVSVLPAALISLPESVELYPGDRYTMNPLGNALYYTWFPQNYLSNPNIANPVANPDVNTRYYVLGRTEFGCTALDSIDIIMKDDSYIDIPNAFSPGSEPNSIFKPVHLGAAKLKTFTVFNRWGTKVFESKDIDKGWDGTLNGVPQPMGVYMYILEAETFKGKRISKSGNVTLLR